MDTLPSRARARQSMTLLACLALAAAAPCATAEDHAAPPDGAAGAVLTLDAAAGLAISSQPLLDAARAAVDAAREGAVAAGQLPDPTLVAAVSDLPVEGPGRYSLDDGSETQLMLGVKQTFPGGNKRALRGSRATADVRRLEAALDEQQRMLRREASLAWLDVWKAVQAQALVEDSLTEARRQVDAAEIAYRAGRAGQADLLAARVSLELLTDSQANLQQQEWHARNQLRRWIGADAERPVGVELPPWPAPDAPALLDAVQRHPHIAAQMRLVDVARADLDLARADYRPDWSVQAGYGHRREFADLATVEIEVALPFFTRNRQDRVAQARAADVARTQGLAEDWLRQHRANVQLNLADWQRLQQRLARYDATILPQAQQRADAALAAYSAGGGSLAGALDARRSFLDIRMQRLDLQLDAARHQVELQYFAVAAQPEMPS